MLDSLWIEVSMKNIKLYTLLAACFSVYIGCAKVQFNDIPCEGDGCAKVTPEGVEQTGTKLGGKKKVDILFVVDNSGSMSTEQNAIAARFSTFINTLDSEGLDYRIGVTTTDVSDSPNNPARTINQNGALQDGKLIKFGNNNYFLTPADASRVSLFAGTIQRQETLNCESFLAANPTNNSSQYSANCPSPDERGIFAANMFVQNQSSTMIRSDAHFALVFLADEDERSSLYAESTFGLTYRLKSDDLPQTLVNRIKALGEGKSFSIHSIIVKPGAVVSGVSAEQAANMIAQSFVGAGNGSNSNKPAVLMPGGDSTCLNTQNSQTHNVRGSYGYLYALATRMTGGVEGDICASDYGSQLTNIGYNITEQINEIELGCPNPEVTSIVFTPASGAPTWTLDGSRIKFSTTLPSNMRVDYKWLCKAN